MQRFFYWSLTLFNNIVYTHIPAKDNFVIPLKLSVKANKHCMKKRASLGPLIPALICFSISTSTKAQTILPLKEDTVYITIPAAEQRFISKNLNLLMSKYDVSIAQANYLQAKLWYNPNISYSQELYNPYTKEYLNQSDEYAVQVQQLITIAGRHSAFAKLNKIGIKQAEYQLADILRSLKYQLYTDLSDLYSNQQLIKLYENEAASIKKLIQSAQEQYKLGNMAGNDVIRLQAELQDVIAQEVTSRQAVYTDEKELQTLLVYPEKTYLVAREIQASPVSIPSYPALLDSAEKNRPDLMLAGEGVTYQQQNIKLQRATAMPDITLGTGYDLASSASPNFWDVAASMDIPFFNRNQGNIAAAKYQESQAELKDSMALYTVKDEVTSAYCSLYHISNQLNQVNPEYVSDLDNMMNDAIQNYNHHYINLLDFLDQVRTYIDAETNLINLHVQYFNAIHYINYTTGIDIIK